jgi:hypothetical protein
VEANPAVRGKPFGEVNDVSALAQEKPFTKEQVGDMRKSHAQGDTDRDRGLLPANRGLHPMATGVTMSSRG